MTMRTLIEGASGVYGVNTPLVQAVSVSDDNLYRFHNALSSLERLIQQDEVSDEMLETPVRRLRRYRFEVSAAPLNYDDPFLWRSQPASEMADQLLACARPYPDYQVAIFEIAKQLDTLIREPTSHLRRETLSLCGSRGRNTAYLLVCDPRLASPVRNMLNSSYRFGSRVDVLTPAMLTDLKVYDRITAIGPPRWYPEFVFNAARTADFEVVTFQWLRDGWRPRSLFGDLGNITGSPSGPVISTGDDSDLPSAKLPDIRPASSNIRDLTKLVADLQRQTRQEAESLDLRLFMLEGGLGVFLEEIDRAKIWQLHLADKPSAENALVQDVKPGSFLLLRTRGGGDYVHEVADRMMGMEAPLRRAEQEDWKSLLRSAVNQSGVKIVRDRLSKAAGTAISTGQIRYWMWSGSIGPASDRDFEAVLDYLNMRAKFERYQQNIVQFRRFHIRAGRAIVRELIDAVEGANTRELTRSGVAEFALDPAGPDEVNSRTVADGGTLTVIRVVERTDIVLNLPARRARQLFDVEDRRWQE